MGGSPDATQRTTSEPWEAARPFLKRGFEAADQFILNRPTSFFPGSTVVPFAPETEAALGATANRAMVGSPVLGAAQNYTYGLLSDPTSSPVFDTVVSDVREATDSPFVRAGRSGSPAHAEAFGRGVARGITPYMESAAARAPSLAREDYYDIDRLAGVGAVRESKAGEHLADAMARHEFAQQEPTRRAQAYQATIAGLPVPTSSTTRQSRGSSAADFLLPAAGAGLLLAGMPTEAGGSLGASALGK